MLRLQGGARIYFGYVLFDYVFTFGYVLDTCWMRRPDFGYVLVAPDFGYVLVAFWLRFGCR